MGRNTLSKKWANLARKVSKRKILDEPLSNKISRASMCQLCHTKKIAVRVQFGAIDETIPEHERRLLLCHDCVLCASCGETRIAARITLHMATGESGDDKALQVYVCNPCCELYEREKSFVEENSQYNDDEYDEYDDDDDDNDDESESISQSGIVGGTVLMHVLQEVLH